MKHRPKALDLYQGLEGWTDPAERAALEAIAREVRGQPILDIGVGGGRTLPLLRQLSPNYTAIDYTPELVARCRKKYPDANILEGDARDLSRFAEGSFALVVFSFNGIDSVNPSDRLKVLAEVLRILQPGGYFVFSAHNQAGPGHREKFSLGIHFTRNPFKLAARVLRQLTRARQARTNHSLYSRLNEQREGYSLMNAAAHSHHILIHYITLAAQLQQLEGAGFAPAPRVFANSDGRRLASAKEDTGRDMWLHFVVQKPTGDDCADC